MIITGLTPKNRHGYLESSMMVLSASGMVEMVNTDVVDTEIWVAGENTPIFMFLRGFQFCKSHYSELAPHTHTYDHGHVSTSTSTSGGASHHHAIWGHQDGDRVNLTAGGDYYNRKYMDGVSNDHTHNITVGLTPSGVTGGNTYSGQPYSATETFSRAGRANADFPMVFNNVSATYDYIGSLGVYVYNYGSTFYENITTIVSTRSGISLGGSGAFATAGTGFVNLTDYVTQDRIGPKNQMIFRFSVLTDTGGRLQYYVGE